MCFMVFLLFTNVPLDALDLLLCDFQPIASSYPFAPLSLQFPKNVSQIVSSWVALFFKRKNFKVRAQWHRHLLFPSSFTTVGNSCFPGPGLSQDNLNTNHSLLNQIKIIPNLLFFSLTFLLMFKSLHQSINKSLWYTLPRALRWQQKKYKQV